jgi:hypothetical protein
MLPVNPGKPVASSVGEPASHAARSRSWRGMKRPLIALLFALLLLLLAPMHDTLPSAF